MGWQVIRQPDGKLGVYDSVAGRWVVKDAAPEEVEDLFAGEEGRRLARELARRMREIRRNIALVAEGNAGHVYGRWAITYQDAAAGRVYLRTFDWDKAAAIIADGRATEATAGLQDDWEGNHVLILEDGKPVSTGGDWVRLGSDRDTPVLSVMGQPPVPCWRRVGDTGEQADWPESALAILRGVARTHRSGRDNG